MDSPLARALKEGRERFNARFAVARRLDRRLEPEAFAEHLRSVVGPIARAVEAVKPDRVYPVAEALFDLSIELFSHDCLGPTTRSPRVGEVWRELLPLAARHLAEDPKRVAAALSNAAHNLSGEPEARPAEWLAAMGRLAPLCPTAEAYLKAGQVAAWRSGMAHFRGGALALLEELPDEALLAAVMLPVGIRPSRRELLAALADPWMPPEKADRPQGDPRLAIVGRVGGFRGFGGPFITPPEVLALEGRLYAFDAECSWSLHADCFGATFQRHGPDFPKGEVGQGGAFFLDESGGVRRGSLKGAFPVLAKARSSASDGTTLAVTVERSHRVYLVALVKE